MKIGSRKLATFLTIGYLAATFPLAFAKSGEDDPAAPDIQCDPGEVLMCADDGTLTCYPDAEHAKKCKNGQVWFVRIGGCQDQDPGTVEESRGICKLREDVNSLDRVNAAPKNPKKGAVTRATGKSIGGDTTGSSTPTNPPGSTSGAGGN